MKFCPYALRARLVLNAKGIPHDTVFIRLYENKPEWYLEINPNGKVPAILDNGKIVVESLDICNYLEEKYPENPLYPTDAAQKQRDQEILNNLGKFNILAFREFVISTEEKSDDEWIQFFNQKFEPIESELNSRGSVFIGGSKPGIVDYMIWPFMPNYWNISRKLNHELPFQENDIPLFRKWLHAMNEYPTCVELFNPPEKLWKLQQLMSQNAPLDYDNL
ncbi:pyrimidodiazepine synthase-like isoform X2 [Cylas formicarius]|nr:pyrimidodiazepine synthase-like isoform X2 [Cylas formicarius]